MSRKITPDERAAMRARYPAGPIHEPDLLAMGMRALDDVPRLLGALDAAEAEVARLCGPHPCCEHCAEDPVHDVAPGEHEMPCTSCEADTLLGRVRRERDYALAVVRDHLPAKPSREDMVEAMLGSDIITDDLRAEASAQGSTQREPFLCFADAILDLWPGRSEAEVKAEAWDEGAIFGIRNQHGTVDVYIRDAIERHNPYRLAAAPKEDR